MITKQEIIDAILDIANTKPKQADSLFGFAIVEACKKVNSQELDLDDLEIRTVCLLESIRMAKNASSSYSEQELKNNVRNFLNKL